HKSNNGKTWRSKGRNGKHSFYLPNSHYNSNLSQNSRSLNDHITNGNPSCNKPNNSKFLQKNLYTLPSIFCNIYDVRNYNLILLRPKTRRCHSNDSNSNPCHNRFYKISKRQNQEKDL